MISKLGLPRRAATIVLALWAGGLIAGPFYKRHSFIQDASAFLEDHFFGLSGLQALKSPEIPFAFGDMDGLWEFRFESYRDPVPREADANDKDYMILLIEAAGQEASADTFVGYRLFRGAFSSTDSKLCQPPSHCSYSLLLSEKHGFLWFTRD